MVRTTLILASLVVLITGPSMASLVKHRTLEQVLTSDVQVVQAQVVSSRLEIEPNQLVVTVEVQDVVSMRTHKPVGRQFVHQYSTVLERSGQRISPIRDGTGLEQRLESGQTYLMLLDSSGEWLLRVEPLCSKEQVTTILKSQAAPSQSAP